MAKVIGKMVGIIYETPLIKEAKKGRHGYYHLFKRPGVLILGEKKIKALFPHKLKFINNSGFQN